MFSLKSFIFVSFLISIVFSTVCDHPMYSPGNTKISSLAVHEGLNIAFVGSDHGIQMLNATDLSTLNTWKTSKDIRALSILNSDLFVAAGKDGVFVLNITDISHIVTRATFDITANDIFIHGHHVFVGTSAGFKVLLDQGNQLTDFGMFSAESKASLTFSAVDSALIYVEDESKGVRLVHGNFLSKSFTYQVLSTHTSNVQGDAVKDSAVTSDDHTMFAAFSLSGIHQINLANHSNPTLAYAWNDFQNVSSTHISSKLKGVALLREDTRLLAAHGSDGIFAFNVSECNCGHNHFRFISQLNLNDDISHAIVSSDGETVFALGDSIHKLNTRLCFSFDPTPPPKPTSSSSTTSTPMTSSDSNMTFPFSTTDTTTTDNVISIDDSAQTNSFVIAFVVVFVVAGIGFILFCILSRVKIGAGGQVQFSNNNNNNNNNKNKSKKNVKKTSKKKTSKSFIPMEEKKNISEEKESLIENDNNNDDNNNNKEEGENKNNVDANIV